VALKACPRQIRFNITRVVTEYWSGGAMEYWSVELVKKPGLARNHLSPFTINTQPLRGGIDCLAVRYWFTFGHFVIEPFPFPLDLDTPLRGWMVKARISFRERTFTRLVQHDHSDGSFLIGRRVGHRVSITDGNKPGEVLYQLD
jgi:hypothetical protein